MAINRNMERKRPDRPVRRLLVMLTIAVALVSVALGCSTEARYKIKTVIFTGVPPLYEEQTGDEAAPAEEIQSATDAQIARQQQHRDALVSRYWQHGPFAAGECGRCHSLGQSKSFLGDTSPANPAAYTTNSVSASSRLLLPKQKLCINCHSQHGAANLADRGLKQHLPAAAGMCTGCHNPHQSLRRYMLLKADNAELCGGCHNPATLTTVHLANPEQDCVECHNAHVGVTSKLLNSDGAELPLLYGDRND